MDLWVYITCADTIIKTNDHLRLSGLVGQQTSGPEFFSVYFATLTPAKSHQLKLILIFLASTISDSGPQRYWKKAGYRAVLLTRET